MHMLPTPYFEHAGITIYHGDSRELLPLMPTVDLILTDPPYNAINRATGGLRIIDKGSADSVPVVISEIAPLLIKLASGSIYVWCSDEQYTEWGNAFRDAGLTTRKCVWWKSNPSPMNGEKLWLSALELCVFARKPKAYFGLHCAHPVWKGPTTRKTLHPTPKPEWLMKELIDASTLPGNLVLDPYMGSGTTPLAAQELGRNAIGIELEEKYCEIAANRLLAAAQQAA